jgi:sugar/nucleoside kinase (ribokinase family)
MRHSQGVLVIGSVHLDVLAKIDRSTLRHVDKSGSLRYSVGGCAFNVSVSLKRNGYDVELMTWLPRSSFSTPMIVRVLKNHHLHGPSVYQQALSSESGFVAHVVGTSVVSAVSCTTVESVELNLKKLRSVIRRNGLVALEANLSARQIRGAVEVAASLARPVSICGVSESKVGRIETATKGLTRAFAFVVVNELEFARIAARRRRRGGSECDWFSTETLLVTRGRRGLTVHECSGRRREFAAPSTQSLLSTLGAGDALYAAACAHYADRGSFDWRSFPMEVRNFLLPVLETEGATPDGVSPIGRKS